MIDWTTYHIFFSIEFILNHGVFVGDIQRSNPKIYRHSSFVTLLSVRQNQVQFWQAYPLLMLFVTRPPRSEISLAIEKALKSR